MKTVFAAAFLVLTLAAVPVSARKGELSGRSDPSVPTSVILAGNTVYGPGEGGTVHEGWG